MPIVRIEDVENKTEELILAGIEESMKAIAGMAKREASQARAVTLRRLRETLNTLTDKDFARVWLEKPRASDGAGVRGTVPGWLEHGRPDHPLVAMLARDEDPELRRLVHSVLSLVCRGWLPLRTGQTTSASPVTWRIAQREASSGASMT